VEVILLDKVAKLGQLGSKIRVKPGFARNYLIPQGKALPATEKNIQRFEAQRAELEHAAEQRFAAARQRAERLTGVSILIPAQAGDEGRLFGSVGTHDIAGALTAAGHEIAKSEIRLPEGPLRHLGDFDIDLHLQGGEIVTTIRVTIVAA
jgi:large subunit ribosomal protein L9